MKRFMLIVLCAIIVLSMAACKGPENGSTGVGGSEQVQIPNPFVSCENLHDAAEIAGFEITLPARLPNWVTDTKIRAMENEMIEIIYTGTEQQELRIRKANGHDDISGQYGSFDKVEEIAVNDLTITVKGSSDKIHVAIWTVGDHAFSVVSKEGLEQAHITDLISGIQ